MVKAIQVGLGHWGLSWSLEVIPHVDRVETVAYVDSNPEALSRLRSELGVPESACFTSLEEAAKAVDAELVIATLRTEAHYPVVMDALKRGYHVIVEKPFASSLAEAAQMVAKANERDRILMVSQNYRFQPAPRAVAKMVAESALGEVNMVSLDFRKHAPSIGYRYWEMPDPLLADMAIHHFDLLRMVLGDNPRRVSCRTWNTTDSKFVHHPVGVATIEFDKGTVVSYRGSWMSGAPDTPWSGEWSMDCSDGEIWWSSRDQRPDGDHPDRLEVTLLGKEKQSVPLPELDLSDRMGTLDAVARAIAEGQGPDYFSSGADNLMSLALVEATVLSASRGGEWIEIADLVAAARAAGTP
ncbi:Gfo/Idh/MocA family protein [Pelagibacterium montanilacus]|uniref:Gfo/Idh/MocA family protein n=1 Tax=Pelagibacterium montanilacus TaxID=2185280 RepID=UPI000F8D4AF8|nr:Gfo/Idh/MocA family oxidoreductase [Pelagibacterium montanilacus]